MSDEFERKWLSDLPADWVEKRADFLCIPYRETVDPKIFEDELVAHYSIPQVQETGGPVIEPASDIDSIKLFVRKPTLLVSKLNPRKKTICIAEPHPEHPTLASSEFVSISSDQMDRRYAYYLWFSEKVTDRLSALVQSATRSHQRVNPADISKLNWKWPPINTQQRIAQFLDEKTARIDGLIEKKRALLDRLTEKRQALITRAVTKGLNPDAPMKPSGIDWLGDIPEHWEALPLKRLVEDGVGLQMGPFGGMITNLPDYETGFKLYGQENTISGNFELGQRWIEEERFEELKRYELMSGDLVITRKGSLGNCRRVPENILPGIADSDTIRIRPNLKRLKTEWALTLLHEAHYVSEQIAVQRRGAILAGLNTTVVGNILLTLPPVEEQAEILGHLKTLVEPCDGIEQRVNKVIYKLTEYRSAVITEAVTGKLARLK